MALPVVSVMGPSSVWASLLLACIISALAVKIAVSAVREARQIRGGKMTPTLGTASTAAAPQAAPLVADASADVRSGIGDACSSSQAFEIRDNPAGSLSAVDDEGWTEDVLKERAEQEEQQAEGTMKGEGEEEGESEISAAVRSHARHEFAAEMEETQAEGLLWKLREEQQMAELEESQAESRVLSGIDATECQQLVELENEIARHEAANEKRVESACELVNDLRHFQRNGADGGVARTDWSLFEGDNHRDIMDEGPVIMPPTRQSPLMMGVTGMRRSFQQPATTTSCPGAETVIAGTPTARNCAGNTPGAAVSGLAGPSATLRSAAAGQRGGACSSTARSGRVGKFGMSESADRVPTTIGLEELLAVRHDELAYERSELEAAQHGRQAAQRNCVQTHLELEEQSEHTARWRKQLDEMMSEIRELQEHARQLEDQEMPLRFEVDTLSKSQPILKDTLQTAQSQCSKLRVEAEERVEAQAEVVRQLEARVRDERLAAKESEAGIEDVRLHASKLQSEIHGKNSELSTYATQISEMESDDFSIRRVAGLLSDSLVEKGETPENRRTAQKRLLLCLHPDKCPATRAATMLTKEVQRASSWLA
eukprot:TRINITY_DN58038_c0_g1_i1.p1 TRINITY_DN58038_c0_g1~~TRINITY_DN58038_c0_g1_i1.p1  ORF type:complete len:599 (+),score=112.33 TRINITY_DN58038_c0_g1_i1:91-1887(+)